jgi:hypothetical protein
VISAHRIYRDRYWRECADGRRVAPVSGTARCRIALLAAISLAVAVLKRFAGWQGIVGAAIRTGVARRTGVTGVPHPASFSFAGGPHLAGIADARLTCRTTGYAWSADGEAGRLRVWSACALGKPPLQQVTCCHQAMINDYPNGGCVTRPAMSAWSLWSERAAVIRGQIWWLPTTAGNPGRSLSVF